MVRFNRSMNDVFNVEESSELLSACAFYLFIRAHRTC